MGTPEFACPTLQKLLDNPEFEIVAVYTREPQIAGRGQKLTNSPIHELALKHNLPIITPKTLRNIQAQQEFIALNADAAVVAAYGLILPQEILQATKLGCINLHPSLLPRWRGPSPIQYTFFSGDQEIGVTIIKMDEGIDSGDMISQQKFLLEPQSNYNSLAPQLAKLGANMIIESLKDLRDKKITPIKQNDALATFSKKLKKEESKIDWNESAEEISRKIRGLSGLLTAFFEFNGEIIKIYEAEIISNDEAHKPGEITIDAINSEIKIQCKIGQIKPLILQKAGKNKVTAKEFLNGLKHFKS